MCAETQVYGAVPVTAADSLNEDCNVLTCYS